MSKRIGLNKSMKSRFKSFLPYPDNKHCKARKRGGKRIKNERVIDLNSSNDQNNINLKTAKLNLLNNNSAEKRFNINKSFQERRNDYK